MPSLIHQAAGGAALASNRLAGKINGAEGRAPPLCPCTAGKDQEGSRTVSVHLQASGYF
jgi:hypothetical protein